jgi:hypothetical protein
MEKLTNLAAALINQFLRMYKSFLLLIVSHLIISTPHPIRNTAPWYGKLMGGPFGNHPSQPVNVPQGMNFISVKNT